MKGLGRVDSGSLLPLVKGLRIQSRRCRVRGNKENYFSQSVGVIWIALPTDTRRPIPLWLQEGIG